MERIITKHVPDLMADDRRRLEALLGAPLEGEQSIFILAYSPNAIPTEGEQASARDVLSETMSRLKEHADTRGIGSDEVDASVEEAMTQVRKRRK